MTLRAAESRGEKCFDQFPGERVADYEAAEADHVQIVVLDTLVRGKSFMDQARSHARHLVGGDGGTDTASADGYAAIHLPASDGTGQRHNKIRIIVIRVQSTVAKVDYLMAGRAQPSDELCLQFKPAMVGGDTDAFRRSL